MAALTGTITSTINTNGLDSTRISEVFNRNFLQHAIDKLVLAEIAEQFELPRNAGTMTMRFFRRGVANVDNVRTLTEGTPISSFTHGTLENIETTLAQYGDAAKITDTRVATDIIKQLELETARMGEEAALHLDTQIRDVAYAGFESKALASGKTGYIIDKLSATAANRVLTVADLDKAATLLSERRAPTFEGGSYIAIVSPRQAYDLRQDATWKNVSTYSDKEKIYKGEIGKLYNVKVVVCTNPKVVTGAVDWNYDGDTADTVNGVAETGHGLTFDTAFVVGRECLGTIKLSGSASPMKPQFIYNDKPDKSDPLGQFHVVGWKAWYASMVLNVNFGVMIRSEQNAL